LLPSGGLLLWLPSRWYGQQVQVRLLEPRAHLAQIQPWSESDRCGTRAVAADGPGFARRLDVGEVLRRREGRKLRVGMLGA
jgi:hypothetical protein